MDTFPQLNKKLYGDMEIQIVTGHIFLGGSEDVNTWMELSCDKSALCGFYCFYEIITSKMGLFSTINGKIKYIFYPLKKAIVEIFYLIYLVFLLQKLNPSSFVDLSIRLELESLIQ